MREGPLHAALKRWYARPGDHIEHPVDGMVIDLVRGDLLIEIQTGGFGSLNAKLDRLLAAHRVRIVHPVAVDTSILRLGAEGEVLSCRRSPKHGQVLDVFAELASIVRHLGHPRLELDVVSTVQQQVRRHEDGRAWRRKGWVIDHRSLIEVLDVCAIRSSSDLVGLLPTGLDLRFTTADVATAGATSRRTAQQMAYCLREMGAIRRVGSEGRAVIYERADN